MNAKLDKICELCKFLCEKESLGQKIVAVGREFRLSNIMQMAGTLLTLSISLPTSLLR